MLVEKLDDVRVVLAESESFELLTLKIVIHVSFLEYLDGALGAIDFVIG